MVKIIVPGKPIPLARARSGSKGFYNPQYQAMKNFAWEVKTQYKSLPVELPIKLCLCFYFPMPKSWSKKKKAALLCEPHCSTPDLSNLIKFVEDALNGVVWKDDALIWSIDAEKKWCSDEGSTHIEFEP